MILRDVSFRYKRRRRFVTEHLTLTLDQRPTVLIGPNGAGKSTVLKLMAGHLQPTSGKVTCHEQVGYSPQHTPTLPHFTVDQQVRYAAWLAGQSRRSAATATRDALALTDLTALASTPTHHTSGGQQARLGIACALVTNPDLLLLDEPTSSLDPLARTSITTVLTELTRRGTGLVITSHTATDVQPPFDRLIVLDHGQIRYDNTVDTFFTHTHDDPLLTRYVMALRG